MRIMVITHEAYCSAQRFFLSGEPDRGLAASRRPFGAVRFPGSPDRHRAIPSRQRSSSMPSYRKNTTNQPTTKVSTLSQDLTRNEANPFRRRSAPPYACDSKGKG